ncbi:MAG: hypothetical protein DRP45_05245 [Candidatus Zixiibacteriota bacterium]|nr:MAG: hypothetical protein DRP45_05245 [candidate division Zixibacteria bacterium]
MPAEQRQKQLLGVARKLFLKKGYRGTTVEEIVRKAHLTKGAFYYHFNSKEDILLAIFKETSERFYRAFEAVSKPGARPNDFLMTLLSIHKASNLAESRNMVDIWTQGTRIPKIHRYLEKRHQQGIEMFTDCLDRSYGRTRKERRELAIFTFSFYEGLAVRKARWPKVVDIESQLKLFSRLVETLRQGETAKGKSHHN